ncbi:MAG: FKBP-type peptidyl-prolyl cis-trans isomerase [Aureispira sp.]
MKSINLFAAAVMVLGLFACNNENKKVKSPQYDLSYAYGSKMGEAVSRFGLSEDERNADKFADGFMKGLEGDSLENVEAQEALQARLSPTGKESEGQEAAEKIAYFMGLSAISPLAQEVDVPASDFDKEAFAEGFRDVVKSDSLELDTPYRDSIFQAYIEPKGQAYQDKMKAKAEAEGQINIAAGQAFLEQNKTEEGVVTTESGLQYKVIEEGTGVQPKLEDQVLTHYHGTLINGNVFDSSVDRGEPTKFGVNQVIKGWQEGIPLMKEGAKYRFFIPQDLAYGMQAPSAKIPAGATLIFDVELIKVNPE